MRRPIRALLALLLLLAPLSASAGAKAVGMVTDLEGAAQRGGQPLDLLVELAPGDQVVLEAGGQCTVTFYGDGHRETVRGPATVQVTPAGLEGAPLERARASAALAALAPRAPAGAARVGMVTRVPGLLVLPVAGEARVPLPLVLELPPATSARPPVRMELRDVSGRRLAAELLMTPGAWTLPLRRLVRPLEPGERVRVVALGADGTEVASRLLEIAAPSPLLDELAAMDAAGDPTPWIARARLLEDAGCPDLALEAVLEALARTRSRALLGWAADLCETLGRGSEARAFRALAAPAR